MEKYASIYANIDKLQKQLLTGDVMIVLKKEFENSQESNRDEILFQRSYRPCSFIKTGPHHECFRENFPKLADQIFFMQHL